MHMALISTAFLHHLVHQAFCLVDRGITFAIAHVRGGGDLGDTWHTEGKMKLKKIPFRLYCVCKSFN